MVGITLRKCFGVVRIRGRLVLTNALFDILCALLDVSSNPLLEALLVLLLDDGSVLLDCRFQLVTSILT